MSGPADPISDDPPSPGLNSPDPRIGQAATLPDTGGLPATDAGALPLAGRYEFLGLLGKGGMGSVYRVRDLDLNEVVALKVLRPDLLHSSEIVERFRREVRLARRVTHHNVARTFDIGEHAGLRYLTMELIEGEPLSRLLRRQGPLPLPSVVAIATQVCDGLAAAHVAGVLHSDLKPDNILVTAEGRVAITDFGIARALLDPGQVETSEARVAGTPTYMAPEQVEGSADIDSRADLYSVGCVLYELLTGAPPWQGKSPYVVAMARTLNPPPDPRASRADLPAAAAALVLRCMARRPNDRFQTASELGAALLGLTVAASSSAPSSAPAAAPSSAPAAVLSSALAAAPSSVPASAPAAAPAGHVITLAIVSFRNTGPSEDEYLAEGITDNLIDILSSATDLRVKGAGRHDRDPLELGRELDVQALLAGSIRKAADSLHIHARLVNVADGSLFWAKHFACSSADAFAAGEEVARAIAAALTIELSPAARKVPTDPRALDLYLRARHEYHQFVPSHAQRAVVLLEEAMALSPQDPTLLLWHALACARLWFLGGERSEELARSAAGRTPGLAHAVLDFMSSNPAAAVRQLEPQALAANTPTPVLAEAHHLLGQILIETGPVEDGIQHLAHAVSLDPSIGQAHAEMALAHALQGAWEQAELLLDEIPAGRPGGFVWVLLARLALWRKDDRRATQFLLHPDMVAGRYPHARMLLEVAAGTRASLDPTEDPAGWLDPAHGSERTRAFFYQVQTEVACALGQADRAIDSLEHADHAGLSDQMWIDRCPLFVSIRSHPRFRPLRDAIAERAGRAREALQGGQIL